MYRLTLMPGLRLLHLLFALLICMLSAASESAETQYFYDDLGRLEFVEYPDGSVIGFDYDANGNRIAVYHGAAGEVGIRSFTPTSGLPGTQVTIIGSGFDPIPTQNDVRFGGVSANVNTASTTSLQVTVPPTAQSGPITVAAGGSSAVSEQSFIIPVPAITDFSPRFVNPTDVVTISGSNLNLVPGSTSFSVQGAGASLVSLSNNEAQLEAPGSSGPILVNTPYGQATSVDSLVILPASIDPGDVVGLSSLQLGAGQTVSISAAGKSAIFEFDAIAGKRLAFRILSIATVPSGSNVAYQLVSPSGSTVMSGSVSSSNPSTIDLPILDPVGTYLMVFSSGTSTAVDITAKIEFYPELAADGSSYSYSGTIPDIAEIFTFNATAGEDLGLGITNVTVTAGNRVNVYVYKPSGGQWKYIQCRNSNIPGCSFDLRDAPETGEYAVKVVPDTLGAQAGYTLTLSHDVTGTLVLDTPQTVTLTVPGQQALLEFTATAGQTVALGMNSIATTPAGESVKLWVYNGSGTYIGGAAGSSTAVVNLTNLAAGTYTVWVSPYDASTGSVELELANGLGGVLPDDGTSQSFNTSVPSQHGYFTFNATSGEDLGLGITNVTVTAGNRVNVYVYKPSGGQWKYMQCRNSNIPGCSIDLRDVPETGEYTVKVVPDTTGAQAGYTLTLSHDVTGTLVLDTPQTVTLTVPGEQALLEFTATAGQTVALGMNSIATTPTGKSVYLRAYNASGTYIGGTAGSSTAVLNLTSLAAGTYTVWVSPYDAATGSVELELASGLGGVLPDDGTSQSFSTSVPSQHGYFTFNATAGEDLGLGITNVTVTAGNRVNVYVYKPSGGQWKYMQCRNSNIPGCSIDLRDVPETGVYTVKVVPDTTGAQAGYTLTLSHDVTGTLVLDTPQTVTLTVPGQQALLEFTATAGQTVALEMNSITTTPTGKSVYLRAYNASGTYIGGTAGSSTAVLNLTNLAAGTYTVWVSPYDAATGSVELLLE